MNFASDNAYGVSPEIIEALAAVNAGAVGSYGGDETTARLGEEMSKLFEKEVAVFPVPSGTGSNALSLSTMVPSYGAVLCHEEAHINVDECGAVELYCGGCKLIGLAGTGAKLTADGLEQRLAGFVRGDHDPRPAAVSITQATELGTIYSVEEISAIGKVCKDNGMRLHMDGARFANALVALDLTPAQMTADLGVDIVSFGGTKNGCWCAEALVFLKPEMANQTPFIRKRAAHLFSKSRFIAAQFDAYFEDGLWLEIARHANAMSARLQTGITSSANARLAWQSPANETFPIVSKALSKKLSDKGAMFYEWAAPRSVAHMVGPDDTMLRLVTSFATTEDHVDQFIDMIG